MSSPARNINELLDSVRAYLLNGYLMSQLSEDEETQLWAVYQSILTQTPEGELNPEFLNLKHLLEGLHADHIDGLDRRAFNNCAGTNTQEARRRKFSS